MARLAVEEGLLTLIGPADDAAAHVASQIATRMRIPVITLSPEGNLTHAGDPWVFRAVPDDRTQARVLLRWAFATPTGKAIGVVVPKGRGGRERLGALRAACRDVGARLASVVHVEHQAGVDRRMASRSAQPPLDALLLWLDPEPALGWLGSRREGPVPTPLLGSLRLDTPWFLDRAPRTADGLALPMLRGAGSPALWTSPVSGHRAAGSPGSLTAALGYDAVQLIVAAARLVGPRPQQIRNELLAEPQLTGRSGSFSFDRRGNRTGAVPVGVVRNGDLIASARAKHSHLAPAAKRQGFAAHRSASS